MINHCGHDIFYWQQGCTNVFSLPNQSLRQTKPTSEWRELNTSTAGLDITQKQIHKYWAFYLLKVLPPLSANLLVGLLCLLKKIRGEIVDSGDSHHFIFDERGLTNMHDISQSFPISLPDGSCILISDSSLSLSPITQLENVMHAPSFNCNPLSISKFTK